MAPLALTATTPAATVTGTAARSARPARRVALVRAQQQPAQSVEVSRRSAGLGAALTAAAALVSAAPPAHAFLGLGGPSATERYQNETREMIEKTNALLALPRDDPAKKDAVAEVRSLTNVYGPTLLCSRSLKEILHTALVAIVSPYAC